MTSSELRDKIQKIIDKADMVEGVAVYCSGGQCWVRVPAGMLLDGANTKPTQQPVRFNMTGARVSEVAMQLACYMKVEQDRLMCSYEARRVMG